MAYLEVNTFCYKSPTESHTQTLRGFQWCITKLANMSLAFIMMSSLCVCVYMTLCIGVQQLYEGPFEVSIVPKMLLCEAICMC